MSKELLALAIAAMSVAALTLPPLLGLFHRPDSQVELSHPVVDGGSILLIATNGGDRPGVIQEAYLAAPGLGPVQVQPAGSSDIFVPAGSKQVRFSAAFKMNPLAATEAGLDAAMKTMQPQSADRSTLKFIVRQARGELVEQKLELEPFAVATLLYAHAARCRALGDRADYENGCEGAEDIHRKLQGTIDDARSTIGDYRERRPKP